MGFIPTAYTVGPIMVGTNPTLPPHPLDRGNDRCDRGNDPLDRGTDPLDRHDSGIHRPRQMKPLARRADSDILQPSTGVRW